jgi:sugar phosphate permease
LDAIIYISLSIATFFRYSILNDKRLPSVFLKTAIPTVIAYSLIPMAGYWQGNPSNAVPTVGIYLFLLITLGCFGFFQFTAFPLSLTIFSSHFNVKTEGSLVGIWSSKSNAGNIIGFFLSNFLVY